MTLVSKYMTSVLAIDTATDACSVALLCEGEYAERYELIPRQHSGRLLPMLRELLPTGDLRAQGVDLIAYGSGPGSFTGLRIVASAVQGLALAHQLPVVAVSTLTCQVQTALRQGRLPDGVRVLSVLPARVDELYWSLVATDNGMAREIEGPGVCHPAELADALPGEDLFGVGTAVASLPSDLLRRLVSLEPEVYPAARDLIPLALESFQRGESLAPHQVLPVYVREEISWKKLAEQGKPG